jgi:transcriptional regulator with XRE-family HTH domain
MFDDFANKKFRDAFLEENIRNRLAFQVRALREKQGWSQPDLGKRTHKAQSVISRIEDPSYGRFTIRTLLDLASAFDVALFISFVPYTKLISETNDVSPEALAVASYKEEKAAMKESSASSFFIKPQAGQLSIEGSSPILAKGTAISSQHPSSEKKGMALAAAQSMQSISQHAPYYETRGGQRLGSSVLNSVDIPGSRYAEDWMETRP